MAIDCDPNALAALAKCFKCLPAKTLQEVQTYLLCQIANLPTGGGGGSGTVTSFSAGNLAPLFTTSVANPNTTPALSFALSNANANEFFVGPSAGVAAAPTFRVMVTADLQTTLTPQFARVGIGQAADAAIPLAITRLALGAVPADGELLQNTTAAANGAQQLSPATRWSGQGFKSNAVSASQTVDFRAYTAPQQGAAAATGIWRLDSQIAGGGFTTRLSVDSTGRVGIGTATPGDPLTIVGATSQMLNINAVGVAEPYMLITSTLFASYALLGTRNTNAFFQHGAGVFLKIEVSGGGYGNIDAGNYAANGNPGISSTFSATDLTTLTFNNGILISNA